MAWVKRKHPIPLSLLAINLFTSKFLKRRRRLAKQNQAESKTQTKDSFDKVTPQVIRLISSTIADLADDDGWAFLGDVGSLLQKKQPNFDSRNFGFQKLTPLIKSIGKFEIEQRESATKGKYKLIYVKIKEKRTSRAKKK